MVPTDSWFDPNYIYDAEVATQIGLQITGEYILNENLLSRTYMSLAEWFKAAVSKTAKVNSFEGSNPSRHAYRNDMQVKFLNQT